MRLSVWSGSGGAFDFAIDQVNQAPTLRLEAYALRQPDADCAKQLPSVCPRRSDAPTSARAGDVPS